MIATVRRAFPDFRPRQRQTGETAEIAEIEELGELFKEMLKILPPSERDAIRLQAAVSASAIRQKLEAELRAGSRTASRMLLGLFADPRDGSH
jgi:hypothetical protein